MWRRLHPALRVLVVVLLALAITLALLGCAAESHTAMDTITESAVGAAGALVGGPIGAAVGAGVAHLYNRAATGDEAASDAVRTATGAVASLGFFGRAGVWLDGVLLWVAVGTAAALLLMPRWRTQVVAFLMGLPRLVASLVKRDADGAKNAITDVVLAAPRIIGAVRESPRTRPKP